MKIVRCRRKYYLRVVVKGILLVLCIGAGILIGVIFIKKKDSRIAEDKRVYICALRKDVESGQVLTQNDVMKVPVINEGESFLAVDFDACIGKRLKQPLQKGSIINSYMLIDGRSDKKGLRKVPYTFIRNADALKRGDFIDIRISFSNGADFVLLGKKEVIRVEEGQDSNERRLWLGLSEEEILRMSSGVVDAYLFDGACIYATLYMNSLQDASIVNYPVNEVVEELIRKDPNIIQVAQNKKTYELRNRIYENAQGEKEESVQTQEKSLIYFD